MVQEPSAHEAGDKSRREQIERRNKLDNLCYTLEKTISENKDKLPEGDVSALESAIKDARAAIEKQDDDAITEAITKLEKEAHRVASVMYEKAGPGAAPPGAGAPPAGDAGEAKKGKDGVIDAEFEDAN